MTEFFIRVCVCVCRRDDGGVVSKETSLLNARSQIARADEDCEKHESQEGANRLL